MSNDKMNKYDNNFVENDYFTESYRFHLKVVKYCKQFSVGDILIKESRYLDRRDGDDWRARKYADIYGDHAQKYEVVHKNDLGLCFLKPLYLDGSYGSIFAAISRNTTMEDIDNGYFRWRVDPLQLDAIMLGEEYDPYEHIRNLKKDMDSRKNHNGNIIVKTNTPQEIETFMNNIKVGDSYWINSTTVYTCESIDDVKFKAFLDKKSFCSWSSSRSSYIYDTKYIYNNTRYLHKGVMAKRYPTLKDNVKVITWKSSASKRKIKHSILEIKRGRFYTDKPKFKKKTKL